MADFVFEEGEAVRTGAAGDHDFVFASGESVTDTGESSTVFEAGTGLGGFALIYNGTDVGYYESDGSHQDFFAVDKPSPSDEPDARGLAPPIAPDDENYHHTVLAHYSNEEGTFAVGGLIWEEANSNSEPDYSLRYGDFLNHDGSTVAFEGSSSSDDVQSDGSDRLHAGDLGTKEHGDAAMFKADGSFTSTISASTSAGTATIVIAGPNDKIFTGSSSVSVDIVGN
jgi:hypothetical protein